MSTTTTYSKISCIEFEFKPDASDPTYSFLQLRLHTPLSIQPHIIYIFPSDATTADHLHNIFLSTTVLVSPEPEPDPPHKPGPHEQDTIDWLEKNSA